ncbi:BzdV protein [candidate division LCP-89 bacterium B3_LCP]|uniref:BzdV protein n=1 Tax=candidate division LCP-89 bacterium B3_LCP TaxID=2012998 RepID=A0A532UYQ5_UNCL8|nr:MAG: BzdV protein [candidate division LCP-89 bacterium B3_LCP]
MTIQIQIDDKTLTVPEGLPVRKAALKNGIYVPGICGHPDLPPAREVQWSEQVYRGEEIIIGDFSEEKTGDDGNCNLCLVSVEGMDGLVRACQTKAEEGMIVHTTGDEVKRARQEALSKILAHHPHACLACAQREGCSLTQCSSNVPEDERCCILLNRCELGKIVDFIGLPDGTPKYKPEGLPKFTSDPFFERDYNLCIGCLRCVRICRDVRGVDVLGATLKDGRIWIGTTKEGNLQESYCRFCGACVEVCPTGALLDKPDSKPVQHGGSAPCIEACPAGIDIPAYIRRIAANDYAGALQVIYDRVPFPGILGYVCFHPCEDVCKRDNLDDSLAICALKRFVYENAPRDSLDKPTKAASTGKKVAIVGSGPAGLTAAYYLARAGHGVEVFEATAKLGGMLRNAIPTYRLPESVLDDELQPLHDLGVTFKLNAKLGQDFQLKDLLNEKFDAVLVSIGTSGSRRLNVPGEDIAGIVQALDFLSAIRHGEGGKLSGKIIVIGGGNVAIDAAMSARRLGADDVTMVCLEALDEMPAHQWEIAQATSEGVKIKPGWGPQEFAESGDNAIKATFKRCVQVFDDQGQFSPQYDENDTIELEADRIIIAIGQQVEAEGMDSQNDLKLLPAGMLAVNPETLETDIPGVFAAGDAVSGPTSVIDAIAAGRQAADSIDRKLGGRGIEEEPAPDELNLDPFLGIDEDFHSRKPVRPILAEPQERVKSFGVIEGTLSTADAEAAALNCLRCHLRANITPAFLPPDKWQPLTEDNVADIPVCEGVYQIADASKKVTKIVGTADVKGGLLDECDSQPQGTLFCWEEDRMYSKRESELIQLHLQQYGEMPGGGGDDDLDDLF